MKQADKNPEDDMLDEYDFAGGVRGKYAARYAAGVTVTVKKARHRKSTIPQTAVAAPPQFPLQDRRPGRKSGHYAEVAA